MASPPLFVGAPTPTPEPSTPLEDGITLYSWEPSQPTRSASLSPPSRQSQAIIPNARFRFRKRFCLLTYAQVPTSFDPTGISEIIHRDNGHCCVSRERHMDGNIHYHAFVDYRVVKDFRNARHWDCHGVHPNVRPVSRTPYAALGYVQKDGDIVHDCLPARPTDNSGGRHNESVPRGKRLWESITDATNKDEFFKKCCTLDPRSTVCSFGNVRSYAEWKFGPDPITYEPYDQSGIAIDLTGYDILRDYFSTWQNTSGR